MSGVLLLESMMLDSDKPFSNEAPDSNEKQAESTALPEVKFIDKTPEIYADMIERPLFIDGRRPVIESEEEPVNEAVGKIEDITLMGIYTQDEQSVALISVQGDNKRYVKKKMGDEVSGWLLQRIEKDRVMLERDGDEQTLLLRKPKLDKTEKKIPAQPENPFKKAMNKLSAVRKGQDEKRKQNEK